MSGWFGYIPLLKATAEAPGACTGRHNEQRMLIIQEKVTNDTRPNVANNKYKAAHKDNCVSANYSEYNLIQPSFSNRVLLYDRIALNNFGALLVLLCLIIHCPSQCLPRICVAVAWWRLSDTWLVHWYGVFFSKFSCLWNHCLHCQCKSLHKIWSILFALSTRVGLFSCSFLVLLTAHHVLIKVLSKFLRSFPYSAKLVLNSEWFFEEIRRHVLVT